jgi:hypothetical protein
MFSVTLELIYCIFVISTLNRVVQSCSQSQKEGLEKDANYIDTRFLGFGAVSLNKYFLTFLIPVGPSETELNAIPSL